MAANTVMNESTSGPIAVSKHDAAQMLGVSLRTIDRLIALKTGAKARKASANYENCARELHTQGSPHASRLTSS